MCDIIIIIVVVVVIYDYNALVPSSRRGNTK